MADHSDPPSQARDAAIRAILLNDWDPHNAGRIPEAGQTAYDLYVPQIAAMLDQGAHEADLVEWLHEKEKETMCFPSLGTARLNRVARKLLATSS